MTVHGDIKKNDALILFEKQIGFVRAWAMESPPGLGGYAMFRVTVNSPALPSISEAVINVNSWDVYRADDPVVLKKITDSYVKFEYER